MRGPADLDPRKGVPVSTIRVEPLYAIADDATGTLVPGVDAHYSINAAYHQADYFTRTTRRLHVVVVLREASVSGTPT